MRKISKKASELIIGLSVATDEMTRKASQPNLNRFYEARQALMDYIKSLESRVTELEKEREK